MALFLTNLLLFYYILHPLVGKRIQMMVKETMLPKHVSEKVFQLEAKVQARDIEEFNAVLPFLYMFLPIVVAVGTFTLCIWIRSENCHLLIPIDFFRCLFKCILVGFLQMMKRTIKGLIWLLGCNKKVIVLPPPIIVDDDWWKVPLLVICIAVLALLLLFLVKWLIGLFKRMRLDNTILLINSDGKWEYAPSPKRLEIDSA